MLNFNQWTFPALAWSLLTLIGLCYLYVWRQTRSNIRQNLCFFGGLGLSAILIASPLHVLGQQQLFFVRMFEYMCQVYIIGAILLQGIPATWLEKLWIHPQGQIFLKWSNGLLISSIGFNACFFLLHYPPVYNQVLQHPWLDQVVFVGLLLLSLLMWTPLFSRAQVLRLPMARQMFYVVLLVLGQVPVFALITFSDQTLYPIYLQRDGSLEISILADQQLGGWMLKVGSSVAFAAAFIPIFLNWNRQQRQQDRSQNQVAYENMDLIKQAKPRKG